MSRPVIELDEKHIYRVNGEIFPSVTQVISSTVPRDLTWWGMRVGVAGVAILFERGKWHRKLRLNDVDDVIQLLIWEKLTTNHIYESRGESGITIHKAMEDWGREEKIPDPEEFPDYDRARVAGLARFILETKPQFIDQEVKTASLTYKYAGTYDARLIFGAGEYQGKHCLLDLKTSKYVYPESHFPQLEAYEFAEQECEQEPTDCRLVLHLPEDGDWTLTPSCDTIDDFLVLLEHHKSLKARKERMKAIRREQKEREKLAAKQAQASI